jgi:hypothetical protein
MPLSHLVGVPVEELAVALYGGGLLLSVRLAARLAAGRVRSLARRSPSPRR